MPFILKKYPATKGKKIQDFLMKDLNFTLAKTQKYLSKWRVFDDGKSMQYGQIIKSNSVEIAMFEGHSRGLKPMFQTKDFAIFDKPSGIMVHPISKNTEYSLLDEIRYHFGENANLAHRIDAETSGLVLVTKNKATDIILKEMFENKEYVKKYLVLAQGKIDKEIVIDTPILRDNGNIGVKMAVGPSGKPSTTIIEPIEYNRILNQTLIQATTLTGRQHQIRVHLNSIGHTIVGDPIYGVDEKIADSYLCKTLSPEDRLKYMGHHRLMLHALYLEFKYEDKSYKLFSKQKFV